MKYIVMLIYYKGNYNSMTSCEFIALGRPIFYSKWSMEGYKKRGVNKMPCDNKKNCHSWLKIMALELHSRASCQVLNTTVPVPRKEQVLPQGT